MATSRFSPHAPRVVAARRAISDLVAQEPSSRELLDEVEMRLHRVVEFDSGGWWTSDPETLLPTELWDFDYASIERELAQETAVRIEMLDAAGRSAAAANPGDVSRNAVISQLGGGLGSEMRVLARDSKSAWGSACFARADSATPFTPEEVSFVAGIANEVGFALRTDLLRIAVRSSSSVATSTRLGTVVLSADDIIEGYTPEARTWLSQLGVIDLAAPLPTALRWISLQARALITDRDAASRLRPARSRMTGTSGELVAVQAEILHGPSTSKVVMSFESAQPKALFPLLLALYGLTLREKTIATLVVRGWPLEDVSAHLKLSLYTVRDHVKRIYAKAGVRSRPELTARLGAGSDAYSAAAA